MNKKDRHDLLVGLVFNYITRKHENQVHLRENNSSYMLAKGELLGACMALELDIEEQDGYITLLTRDKRKVVLKAAMNDFVNK